MTTAAKRLVAENKRFGQIWYWTEASGRMILMCRCPPAGGSIDSEVAPRHVSFFLLDSVRKKDSNLSIIILGEPFHFTIMDSEAARIEFDGNSTDAVARFGDAHFGSRLVRVFDAFEHSSTLLFQAGAASRESEKV